MNPTALAYCLTHPKEFSETIIDFPLYQYQIEPITAVLDSVLNQSGHEFLIVMPRQSGKNEAVAHLLVMLLNLYQRRGGQIVYGAIGDGLGRGIHRLEARLNNPLNQKEWTKLTRPTRRLIGKAACVFLSTHPAAFSRGETADILLAIDELQDQQASHIEQVFEPMRAARNATAVFFGTVKFSHDALWLKMLELKQLTAKDGIQRVFFVLPDQVTAENELYGRFLARKVESLGRNHPIVAAEYYLEPLDGSGGLFDSYRQSLMRGNHKRTRTPDETKHYIATIDVAGQDEATTNAIAQLDNPGRDYTICTIFEINLPNPDLDSLTYTAVDIFVDHGGRHFQSVPGRPSLADKLNTYLNHWQVVHTICDMSGVGEGLTDWLITKRAARNVTGYKFNKIKKAELGSQFITIIETGRFRYWIDDEDDIGSDGWWFWKQTAACRYEIPPDGRYERDLRWFVPASHITDINGDMQQTHDDRLLSAALIAVADDLYKNGIISLSQAKSAIIAANDPLDNMEY